MPRCPSPKVAQFSDRRRVAAPLAPHADCPHLRARRCVPGDRRRAQTPAWSTARARRSPCRSEACVPAPSMLDLRGGVALAWGRSVVPWPNAARRWCSSRLLIRAVRLTTRRLLAVRCRPRSALLRSWPRQAKEARPRQRSIAAYLQLRQKSRCSSPTARCRACCSTSQRITLRCDRSGFEFAAPAFAFADTWSAPLLFLPLIPSAFSHFPTVMNTDDYAMGSSFGCGQWMLRCPWSRLTHMGGPAGGPCERVTQCVVAHSTSPRQMRY